MLKNKSQISIEYLILTGFILLVLIIPAVIFLYSMANNSVYGTVNTQKIVELGDGLVSNAKQLYYLGLYSKRTVSYDMPQGVWKMFIVKMEGPGLPEPQYYIGMIINDTKEGAKYFFQSSVPLAAEHPDYVDTSDNSDYIPECSSAACSFYNFQRPVTKPGRKQFKVETKLDPASGEVKAYIKPLINPGD